MGVNSTTEQALTDRGYIYQFEAPIRDTSMTLHVIRHMDQFIDDIRDLRSMKPWTYFLQLNGADSKVIFCCTDDQDAVFIKMFYESN